MLKKLAIILPCYNEEDVLPQTIKKMSALLAQMIKTKQISKESLLCFVNDGSQDKSWDIIREDCRKNPNISAINLSKNFEKQGAILAGMYEVSAEVYVTIDADLQDDISCIPKMLDEINAGNDIVYGVRKKRDGDTFFKKYGAHLFYRLLKLLGVNVVYNHADFRMMTKRAVETLKRFPERNLFLRAIIPLLGFKFSIVYYNQTARKAGETKYPFSKMTTLAWNAVSDFSIIPLRLVTFLGFGICFLGFIFLCYVIYRWFIKGTIVGWTSLVTIITVFSGVQLLSLGIIGEYLAKVFIEVKKRPLFIVDEKINLS